MDIVNGIGTIFLLIWVIGPFAHVLLMDRMGDHKKKWWCIACWLGF